MKIRISFPGVSLLGIAFIVLKLCNVIDWSWWFVLAPFWPLGIAILAIAGILTRAYVRALVGRRKARA